MKTQHVVEDGRAVLIKDARTATLEAIRAEIDNRLGAQTEKVYLDIDTTKNPTSQDEDRVRKVLHEVWGYFDWRHERVNPNMNNDNYRFLDLRNIVLYLEETWTGKDTSWFQR